MNSFMTRFFKNGLTLVLSVGWLMAGTTALAAENTESIRPLYDSIMVWVNFFIFVFVLVKFGKEPLKQFLMGKRIDVANEIEQLEKQRDDIQLKTQETLKELESSKTAFKEITQKLIEAGEKARTKIIEEAKIQSQQMLEDAKRKIEVQLLTAKKDIRSDLIDASVDLALKSIGAHVTPKDDERLIKEYLEAFPGQQA